MLIPPSLLQLKPRERLLALGTGLVVLALLLDRAVIHPWLRHARHVREEIGRLEDVLQRQHLLLARRERVLSELARYQRYLQPAVADDLQMAALLKEIEQLAGETRIAVTEIKPLDVETDETSKRYSLEVRFACTLDDWVAFVHRVESSPSLYTIVRAGLSKDEERPEGLEGYLRVMSTAVRS
jgi:Tfp pilus assembly protein PilO